MHQAVYVISAFIIVAAQAVDWGGPRLLQQPPMAVTFSNGTGAVVSCRVSGDPQPRVTWEDRYGAAVTAVAALRQVAVNGSLVYLPFRSDEYRRDVHTAVVRCRAVNTAGTVISRYVTVRAVVTQPYDVLLDDVTVTASNTAVFRCRVSSYVTSHVTADSWRVGDRRVTAGDQTGRIRLWRDLLLIGDVSARDNGTLVRCRATSNLTRESRQSGLARLQVYEPVGLSAPRLWPDLPDVIRAEAGSDTELYCLTRGFPPPRVQWYEIWDGQASPLFPSGRTEVSGERLTLRQVRSRDAARYRCTANSSAGGVVYEIRIKVTVASRAMIEPSQLLITAGQPAQLTCHVTPPEAVTDITWIKDGRPLATSAGQRTLGLAVGDPSMAGMYQCHVTGDLGTAQVKVGAWPVRLLTSLVEQTVQPGDDVTVTLTCTAAGSPPPLVTWTKDGVKIRLLGSRYHVRGSTSGASDVTSQLTIHQVVLEDGGVYRCRAENSAGSAEDSAKLNVYGPATALSRRTVTVSAGSAATLSCPVSGYPLSGYQWRLGDLPVTPVPHRVLPGGRLAAGAAPGLSAGQYSCQATGGDGRRVTGFVDVVVIEPPHISPFSFPAALDVGDRAQASCLITSGDLPITITWLKDNNTLPADGPHQETIGGEFYSNLVFKHLQERQAGVYTCQAANRAAVVRYSAVLTVRVPPRWLHPSSDTLAVLGSDVTLNCSAAGQPPPTVTWALSTDDRPPSAVQTTQDGHLSIGADGSLTLQKVVEDDAGDYSCRVSNGVGAPLRRSVRLTVTVPARFHQRQRNVSVTSGSALRLTCAPSGDGPLQLTWYRHGHLVGTPGGSGSDPSQPAVEGTGQLTVTVTAPGTTQLTVAAMSRTDGGSYTCVARNRYGEDSTTWHVTVTERPEPPGDLQLVSVSSRSVLVTWSPSYDGNSRLTHYVVQHVAESAVNWTTAGPADPTLQGPGPGSAAPNHLLWKFGVNETVPGRQRGVLVAGLQPSTTYRLRALAVNRHGSSRPSAALRAQTEPEPPGGPPLNVRLQPLGSHTLRLTWNPPPESLANGKIIGYTISYVRHIDQETVTRPVRRAELVLLLRRLQPATAYSVTVRAFNQAGDGPDSSPVTASTWEGVPNLSPRDVTCEMISETSVRLTWRRVTDRDAGGRVTGYRLTWRRATLRTGDQVHVQEERTTTVTLSGLSPFTNYTALVSVSTTAGQGPNSPPVSCVTATDVPGPPSGIKLVSLSATSMLVSWQPPSNPRGHINRYLVYQRKQSTHDQRRFEISPEHRLMLALERLDHYQRYEVWITAVTSAGEGAPSHTLLYKSHKNIPARIASFSRLILAERARPLMVDCISLGHPAPRPVWTSDRPLAELGAAVRENGSLFIIHVSRQHVRNWTCSVENVYGRDAITVQLVVQQPPSVNPPTVLRTTQSQLTVRWTLQDGGNAPLQAIHAQYRTGTGPEQRVTLYDLRPEVTLDGLRCGTEYTVSVTSQNTLGLGPQSESIYISTQGSKPGPLPADALSANASCIRVRLYGWPAECDVTGVTVRLRPAGGGGVWTEAGPFGPDRDLAEVCGLRPATVYQVVARADSEAGQTETSRDVATLTLDGATISPLLLPEKSTDVESPVFWHPHVIALICSSIICAVCLVICLAVVVRNR